MNSLPASIVIRQLMATPPTTTHRPSRSGRTGRPAEKRATPRRLAQRLVVSAVLVAAALGFVVLLTVRTSGTA